MKAKKELTREQRAFEVGYANFVDDLGGFLWHIRAITGKSFETIAHEINLSSTTLYKLAHRITKNPQGSTMWKILRGLDDRQIIRHSMLEQYRPLNQDSLKNTKKAA